jgi:hypothetical protein
MTLVISRDLLYNYDLTFTHSTKKPITITPC